MGKNSFSLLPQLNLLVVAPVNVTKYHFHTIKAQYKKPKEFQFISSGILHAIWKVHLCIPYCNFYPLGNVEKSLRNYSFIYMNDGHKSEHAWLIV